MEPESAIVAAPALWPPAWLEPLLVSDARFARAYEALGDRRRALLKRVIAAQYALFPPRPTVRVERREVLPCGLVRRNFAAQRPFVLILCDAGLDAPAFLLAALLPVLTSRPDDVLVVRLGDGADVPDTLLAACELAGQESVAALGPRQAARLVVAAAAANLPGLVISQDSPALRRILASAAVDEALRASAVRTCALRMPQRPGLWRDAPKQFPPEDVELLYGATPFAVAEKAGAASLSSFAAARDLLLLPDARAGEAEAACVVGETQLGMFCWPELAPELLACSRSAFSGQS